MLFLSVILTNFHWQLLSLANSYGTYFHQGYDYLEDMKEFNNDIASKVRTSKNG